MTAAEPVQLATLIVTGGSVAFALASSVWAYRLTAGARKARKLWRDRILAAEDRAERNDSLFAAHPGVVVVWDGAPHANAEHWSAPRLYGSPAALASLLQFAELSQSGGSNGQIATDILDSISDFTARTANGDTTSFRDRARALMSDGAPFSLTISGPSGRQIQVDGRPAGRQLVIWLTDTALRQAENAAQSSDTIGHEDPIGFMDMMGRNPVPAWRLDEKGRLTWVNAAYVKAVEARDVAEVIERQVLLEPSLADQARDVLNAVETRTSARGVVLAGQRRVMSVTSYPVQGGVAGFAVDVTDGEEAKAALNRFREAHDLTLNHMTEAVAIFDRAKKLVFYNQAFSQMFNVEEAFLNDRPAHGVLLDRLREKRRLPEQADYSQWRTAELARYEAAPGSEAEPDELWALPDGRTLRVARQRHPMGGLLVIFEDMTDQLSLQARYNTQIKVQRATLDKLHEAVAVFGSDGRLKLRNAAFETLWKLDPDTLDGVHFDDVVTACQPLYDNGEAWGQLKARITDPSPESRKAMTGEIRRADNSVLTWLTRPLPDGATVIAWDDITDSRRIESALRDRAEALEASERIKTEFVEHVSYQLRTPLTTIHGYADLLAGGFAGDLSERQKEHMGAIQTASGQLGKLIDDILDIAAIDAGQLELELGDVNLHALAEESSELIASRAEHSGIKLTLNADQDASLVRADAKRLKQVFYNLLTNAMDHVNPGGAVEVGADVTGEDVSIWVADDGVGIAPDRQAKIFERFERGDGGGAGLGLALVNDIIRLHGGWVELESEPGEGTRVTCHLPRITSSESAPELDLPGNHSLSAE
jgi:signal transduction histidine kinase